MATYRYVEHIFSLKPTAFWRLGELLGTTAADQIERYPGTYNNTPTLGQTGVLTNTYAVLFTAANSESVTFGDVLDFDHDDSFSVTGFVKTTAAGTQCLVSKQEAATNFRGWNVYMNAGQLYFSLSSVVTTDDLVVRTTTTCNDGNWHHFMVTYDGTYGASGVHIYLDGVDESLTTVRDGLDVAETTLNAADLCIAARDDTDQFFEGTLDEIAIFASELTLRQARGIYYASREYSDFATRILLMNPVSYLRMGEAAGSTCQDLTLNNIDGTINGSPTLGATSLTVDTTDDAIAFDKTSANEYVTINGLSGKFADGQVMTIGLWFSTTDATTGGLCLFSAHDASDVSKLLVHINHTGGAGVITIQTGADSAVSFGSGLNDGNSHFIALVFTSATNCDVYIDYQQVGFITCTSITWSSATKFSLAQEWDAVATASEFFDGTLDEFFICDAAMTALELNSVYVDGRYAGLTYNYLDLMKQLAPMGLWRLGEADSLSGFADEMGNQNGTEANTILLYGEAGAIAGESDTCLKMVSGSVALGTTFGRFSADQPFSGSIWFKTTETTSSSTFFSTSQGGTPYRGWEVVFQTASSGYLQFRITSTSGTNEAHFNSATAIGCNDGLWHHLVFTYDGSTDGTGMHLILDGVDLVPASTSGTLVSGATIVSGQNLMIGARGSGSYTFRGWLDEAMLFSRELSLSEARMIYSLGRGYRGIASLIYGKTPVAYWRMGDASGTVTDEMGAYDSTAVTNNPAYGVYRLPGAAGLDTAMKFVRASVQSITVNNGAIVGTSADFTMMGFIKMDDAATNGHYIICEESASWEAASLYIDTSGYAHFKIRYTGAYYDCIGNASDITLEVGRVYMIAGRLDSAGGMSVFVNGRLAGTDANTNASNETVTAAYLAARLLGTDQLTSGTLDEIAVIDAALTDDEIDEIYMGSFPYSFPTLAGSEVTDNAVVSGLDTNTVMMYVVAALVIEDIELLDAPGIPHIITETLTAVTLMEPDFLFMQSLADSTDVTDSVVVEQAKLLIENFIATGSQSDNLRAQQLVTQNMSVLDLVLLTWELVAIDTITGTTTEDVIAQKAETLVALFAASGVVTDTRRAMYVVVEALVAQALSQWNFEQVLTDSADFTDTATDMYRAVMSLVDSIAHTDAGTGIARINVLTLDALDLADPVSWNQRLTVEAIEAMAVGGTLVLDGDTYTAVVLNATTLAPSEYNNFPFNSFGQMGSTYLGATDTAIYALTGDDDDGNLIDASVLTGLINFGTSQYKRVPRAYLGYTSDGALVLKTIGTGGATDGTGRGTKIERWYELTSRTADAPATARIKLGRGVKATYWQFELTNKDGADFELSELKLLPVVLSRRV